MSQFPVLCGACASTDTVMTMFRSCICMGPELKIWFGQLDSIIDHG